eukprot:Sdes_comp20424_c0_seq1m14494
MIKKNYHHNRNQVNNLKKTIENPWKQLEEISVALEKQNGENLIATERVGLFSHLEKYPFLEDFLHKYQIPRDAFQMISIYRLGFPYTQIIQNPHEKKQSQFGFKNSDELDLGTLSSEEEVEADQEV